MTIVPFTPWPPRLSGFGQRQVFTEGVVGHWNRLLREVVESPHTEVLKRFLDVAFGDVLAMNTVLDWLTAGFNDLPDLSQP